MSYRTMFSGIMPSRCLTGVYQFKEFRRLMDREISVFLINFLTGK